MGLGIKRASDIRYSSFARAFGIALLIISVITVTDGCSKSGNKLQIEWEVKSDSILSNLTTTPRLQEGYKAYRKYGCILCHGINGEKGIKNKNAQTGEEIPALTYVAEGYTREELKQQILKGLKDIPKKNSLGQTPPYRMPSWKGVMKDGELEFLTDYLLSLMPEEEQEGW